MSVSSESIESLSQTANILNSQHLKPRPKPRPKDLEAKAFGVL